MASVQIQALLERPDIHQSEKRALALLDSQFKSLSDLEEQVAFAETVEQAARNVEELKLKLSQSQDDVDTLIAQSSASVKDQLETAQELSLLRHSLADELLSLSQSLVSSVGSEGEPTLLEDLETSHRQLKALESVNGYVKVIEHALHLSDSAVKHVETSRSFPSTGEYEALQKLVASAHATCAPVEDVAGPQKLHILVFLETVRDQTWLDMKRILSSALLSAAEKLNWPMPVDYASSAPNDRAEFEATFSNLLKLQTIGKRINGLTNEASDKTGLYPLQALVQPISLRFKYHFEGTRQTNRLDKPEWYFTHILNVSHQHHIFMETTVQSLLANSDYNTINAWREFTALLFALPERKLKRTVPLLLPHPPVLAHTIYQALAFDSTLRDEGFDVSGTSAGKHSASTTTDTKDKKGEWIGISEVILGRKEWFDAWLEGERKFAMQQYMDIITAPDAWLIADDDGGDDDNSSTTVQHELRPTNSARRVKALVEQITDRYSPLPQFTHRTRFLITVQLPVLESFQARISSSLDAFETLSSAFMRAVPGGLGSVGNSNDSSGRGRDTNGLTSGVEGVQRLYKALVSAKYMGVALEAWGEDLFFLELWAEINHRASLRSHAQATASLPNPSHRDAQPSEDTIFEELVTQYATLVTRAEDMIVHCVSGEVETDLKPHFSSNSPTHVTPSLKQGHDDDIMVSPTLLGPLSLLSSHLSFLRSTLPQTLMLTLYRRIAARLSAHILQRQIFYRGHGRISVDEGRAILAECELWVETCRIALARDERARVEGPWRQLLQASRLVGAEGALFRKAMDATLGITGDQEWEEVMLETVGLAHLSREEASQILRTRTDCER
ncbi:RINT-1 family protein [Amylocystis lapponica]|nr:RINT-1 family protein [Amylocystis lapponica]